MNAFDVVMLALACVLVVIGMVKGLVRIVIGVAALIAAFVLAARLHEGLALQLPTTDIGIEWLSLVAYLMIFVGVMLGGAVMAWFARRVLKAAMLGWADRLGGAALGLLAALLAGGIVLLPLVAYLPASERVLAGSKLAPYVSVVADVANRLVPDSLSSRYRQKVEALRERWRREVFADA